MMIANERQYRITTARAAEFEASLTRADEEHAYLPDWQRQLVRDGLAGQLASLRAELQGYEDLRSGRVT